MSSLAIVDPQPPRSRHVRSALRPATLRFAEGRSRHERDRVFWNRVYDDPACVAPTLPNRFLRDVVRPLRHGRALDVGVGNGRNACYLASSGWDVTGVDVSDVALGRACLAAARQRLDIDFICGATSQTDIGSGQWDLIVECYGELCRPAEAARVAAALAPGGMFVAEAVCDQVGMSTTFGWRSGYAGRSLLERYGPHLRVLHYEHVLDIADWGASDVRVPLVRLIATRQP